MLVVCLARTLPRGPITSHCQPGIFISCPTNLYHPALQSVALAAYTEYLLSNAEAKISCWKGGPGPERPGKRKGFLMCVYACVYTGHIEPALQTNWCHQLKVLKVSSSKRGKLAPNKSKVCNHHQAHGSSVKARFRLLGQNSSLSFLISLQSLCSPFPTP